MIGTDLFNENACFNTQLFSIFTTAETITFAQPKDLALTMNQIDKTLLGVGWIEWTNTDMYNHALLFHLRRDLKRLFKPAT